jgi:drug/metabolite transporter (DMT)-like permease
LSLGPFSGHRYAVGVTLAITMAALWGASTVWIRDASAGFDAAAAVSVRMPVVVLFLLALALFQPRSDLRRRALPRQSHLPLALSGILGTGITGLFIVISLHHIGAGSFTVLFSTAPLFGMVLAAIFLGERITAWLLVGALLIVGGIALIA